MGHSKKKILSLARETLRKNFDDLHGEPLEFDKLPRETREAIIAAAESMRTPLGARTAIEEKFREMIAARLEDRHRAG